MDRGIFSLIDAAAALCLAAMLLLTVSTRMLPSNNCVLLSQISYYQKVADQIILVSSMNGYFDELAREIELGKDVRETLLKIIALCPQKLCCRISVYDHRGRLLRAEGMLHDTIYGEAGYFISTSGGTVEVLCQVGER